MPVASKIVCACDSTVFASSALAAIARNNAAHAKAPDRRAPALHRVNEPRKLVKKQIVFMFGEAMTTRAGVKARYLAVEIQWECFRFGLHRSYPAAKPRNDWSHPGFERTPALPPAMLPACGPRKNWPCRRCNALDERQPATARLRRKAALRRMPSGGQRSGLSSRQSMPR